MPIWSSMLSAEGCSNLELPEPWKWNTGRPVGAPYSAKPRRLPSLRITVWFIRSVGIVDYLLGINAITVRYIAKHLPEVFGTT